MYEHISVLCKYILFKNKIKESSHIFFDKKRIIFAILKKITEKV